MAKRVKNSQIISLFLVLFVSAVGFGIVIPILPLLARELGVSPFQLGVMTASFSVVQFIFAPMWGRLSDRIGKKPVLLVGIVGIAISFFFMGVSRSFLDLLLSRVLGGLLAAATLPAAQALAAELSGDDDRARAMGLMGAAFGTGFIFGPVIGGSLAPFGISIPFFAGCLMSVVTAILAIFILPNPPSEGGSVTTGPRRRFSLFTDVKEAIGGPGAPYYWLAFVIMFSQSSMMTALAYFMTDRFGADTVSLGIIYALNGVCGALIQGAAIGSITRRLGDHTTILWGLGAGVLGFLLMVSVPSFVLAVIAVMLTAVSMSLTRPTATSALSKSTSLPQGVTMGLQGSFDSMGRFVGPLWAGYMYQISQGAPFVSAAVVYAAAFVYILGVAARARQATLGQIEQADRRAG